MARCEICNGGGPEGPTLFRMNEKGVDGIWRCRGCMTVEQDAALDPELVEIVEIIERGREEDGNGN